MKITKIKLTNWGPHKSLIADTDGPVVGLVGINGSGKTSILEALQFAFTGILDKDRPQATYVHRYPAENPPPNGIVTVDFVKDGSPGRITRQVGKTPRRVLEWDGESYSSAAEIDKVLAEVLDCEKRAISMAVFLSQGCLTDFLFSTPANRESMFQKILMLEHTIKVAEIAGGKAGGIEKNIEDLSGIRDEASRAVLEASDKLEAAASKYSNLPDPISQLEWFTEAKRIVEECLHATGEILVARSAFQTAQNQLAALPFVPGLSEEEHSPEFLRECQERAAAVVKAQDDLKTAESQLALLLELLETIGSKEKELAESAAKVNALAGSRERLDRTERELEVVKARLEKTRVVVALSARLALVEESIQDLTKRLEEADNELKGLDGLKEALPAKREYHMLLELRHNFLLALEKAKSGHEECMLESCPLCGTTGSLFKNALKAYNMETVARNLAEAKKTLVEMEAKLRTAQENVSTATTAKELARKQAADLTEEIIKASGELGSSQSADELQRLATDQTHEVETLRRETSELGLQEKRIVFLTSSITESNQSVSKLPGKKELESRIEELNKAVTGFQRNWDAVAGLLSSFLHKREQLSASIKVAADRVSSAEIREKNALDEYTLHTSKKGWEQWAGKFPDEKSYLGSLQEAIKQLEKDRDARIQALGEREACRKALDSFTARVVEIDKRIDRNRGLKEAVSDLRKIEAAFSRGGISRRYMLKVFELLAFETQLALEQLDADFQVEMDPEQPFNFLFWNTELSDEVKMDQSQLSGGQKIRLATAFVQALQALIFPNLGFLVLDEPSTHLDEGGVDSLAHMISNLGAQLMGTESQVFVCDHRRELRNAFSKVICLTENY